MHAPLFIMVAAAKRDEIAIQLRALRHDQPHLHRMGSRSSNPLQLEAGILGTLESALLGGLVVLILLGAGVVHPDLLVDRVVRRVLLKLRLEKSRRRRKVVGIR